MLEVIYDDWNNEQLSKDLDELECTQPMWQNFIWNVSLFNVNSLAVMTWKDGEEQTLDELAGQLQQYINQQEFFFLIDKYFFHVLIIYNILFLNKTTLLLSN